MRDAGEFTELYRQHATALYRFALHMSGSEAVAEEVTQDVFLALIRQPNGFDRQRGNIGGYLYGIARHMVRRHLAHDRRFQQVDADDDSEQFLADGDPLEDLTRTTEIEALQQAVLRLPEKYREAIVLCDLQELSYESAATAIGCAVGTVRSRLHRGRGILIAKLQARCAV